MKANVISRYGKYCVRCYDNGWVLMSELNENNEWQVCVFDTIEEAQAEADRYNECWNKN